MKQNKSFTLIELLVVVIILGILAALAIPMYTNAIEQRKGEACANNIRTIMTAWRIYNMNHTPLYLSATNCSPATLNDNLGINIQENNFSATSDGTTPGFNMQFINSNNYNVQAFRLTGSLSGNSVICTHYPNGTVLAGQTVYYAWSGTWPWKPANE